ncbi:MAG: SPOR domain-containing protein [Longimicrobiales bacterium]
MRTSPFDPAGELPSMLDVLLARPRGSLPALALLIVPSMRDETWPLRAVVRVARALSDAGHDPLIVDLSLDEPFLSRHLDLATPEGAADLLLYGASLDRVEQRVSTDDGAVRVVAAGARLAGSLIPDALGALRTLVARARLNRRTLVLLAPADEELGKPVAAAAGTVLLIGETAAPVSAASWLPVDAMLVGALGAPEHDAAAAAAQAAAERVSRERRAKAEQAAAVRPVAPIPATEPAELPPITEPPAQLPPITEPPIERRRRRPPRRSRLAGVLLVLLGVALIGVVWYAWRESTPFFGRRAAAPAAPDTPRPAPPTSPVGGPLDETPLPYSVAVESHPDLERAVQRAAALRRQAPATGFYVSPLLLDSVVYYRVLAGPAADTASAAALMNRLVAEGHKSGPDDWSLRPTPWAFLIGDYPTEEAAARREAELQARGLPTYVVEVPYSSGGSLYRIYAGAFEGPALADVLQQLLRDAGVEARLVRRTGKPKA